jgi:DNA primase
LILKESIDEVINVAHVEEVVGDFVQLKKRGSNYIGLCPFHDEKTPSFAVSPTKGIYKCFGCGAAGGSVNFVMELEQLSFPEAIRFLADKYNIELKETEQTDEAKQEADRRESVFIVNAFARDHFQKNLEETEEGRSVGLSYFKERGFSPKTIEAFELGYSMQKGNALLQSAKEGAFDLEIMKEAGLIREREGEHYDFFRGRVMFPIHNISGRVIAFGGRVLKTTEKAPKYINTPESEVYIKSKILYGAFQAKKATRAEENCFLVEGYTDVISLYQAGIENTMASSGTSLTPDQVRLLRRFTPKVTMLYDGDKAGIKAALRGVDIILEQGLDVKVVVLPEGEDPDSFVSTSGAQAFHDYVAKNAKDFILFKADQLQPEAGSDPVKMAEVVKELVNSISIVPDPIRRSLYVKECAEKVGLEEGILITEVNKKRRNRLRDKKEISRQEAQALEHKLVDQIGREQPQERVPISEKAEQEVIGALLNFGSELLPSNEYVAVHLVEESQSFEWKNPRYYKIFKIFQEELSEGRLPLPTMFTTHEDNEVLNTAIEAMMQEYQLAKWEDKEITVQKPDQSFQEDADRKIKVFKKKKLEEIWNKELEKLKDSSLSTEEIKQIHLRRQKIYEMIKALDEELGRHRFSNPEED